MLGSTSYRDLKVVDIAREAGTSPATFYQYFTDVDAAIAELAGEMATEGATRLSELLANTTWAGEEAGDSVRGLVIGFLQFWEANRPLMSVIDLLAAEGEGQVRATRADLLATFSTGLADRVRSDGNRSGATSPWAMASVAVTMLVNVAIQREMFEASEIPADDLIDSVARLLQAAVTGTVDA